MLHTLTHWLHAPGKVSSSSSSSSCARSEVLTAVKIQVEVFWVVTLVFYQNTTRRHNPEELNLNASGKMRPAL
jgi:hypothetical protein